MRTLAPGKAVRTRRLSGWHQSTQAETKAATGLQARRMEDARAAAGICIPGRPWGISLVGRKQSANGFSSGGEKPFVSESKVDSGRVTIVRRRSPEVLRNYGGMELSAGLL